jgi:hypothetical protein
VISHGSTVQLAAAQHQRDRVADRAAGWAYTRAGSGKQVAHAHGARHRSTGTRYQQGASWSPLAQALRVLVDDDHTAAWPAITEARIIVTRAEISTATSHDLLRQKDRLEQTEIDINRDILLAPRAGGDMRELRARQLDLVQELAAIEDELRDRKGR